MSEKKISESLPLLAIQDFMIRNMESGNTFESSRRELYNSGIKTSFDEDRVIFSTIHSYKNQTNNILLQECNGLILDKKTWNPLVVPPRSLRFNIETNKSNRFLIQGLYHIYLSDDGTCFNLYYWNNKWIISTTSGYEMNNIKWDEKQTYQELISECLDNRGYTWETFTELLDVKNCYSFGFKHPKLHKFSHNDSSIYKIWHIQSINLDNTSIHYMWSQDKSPIYNIVDQQLYYKSVDNIKDLYNIASNALNNYISGVDREPCYGFILRSVNFRLTGQNSDLFIESSLMRTIRKIWYENKFINTCRLNKWNIETAVTLRAYMNGNLRNTFISLFPGYKQEFNMYKSSVSSVVNCMINTIEKKEEKTDVKYEEVSKILLDYFNNNIEYNINNKNTEQKLRVLTEYVNHHSNLEYLMLLFNPIVN